MFARGLFFFSVQLDKQWLNFMRNQSIQIWIKLHFNSTQITDETLWWWRRRLASAWLYEYPSKFNYLLKISLEKKWKQKKETKWKVYQLIDDLLNLIVMMMGCIFLNAEHITHAIWSVKIENEGLLIYIINRTFLFPKMETKRSFNVRTHDNSIMMSRKRS